MLTPRILLPLALGLPVLALAAQTPGSRTDQDSTGGQDPAPQSVPETQSGPDTQSGADTQSGPGDPTGSLSREEMWYAPTEEDWAKPCLIRWQRTYEDAQRVSEESGKPILVCVNMDGEIASEHYAGIRYRQPEVAKLYEPYVCVIASVYRHTPRDYDEFGERIACPRFGGVTCGEHMRIEPGLYQNFLDDTRVAPRHIMVEDGSKETFDVYYAFDTKSVFNTLRAGIEERPPAVPSVERGDQSLVERVSSRDAYDRDAVEEAYRAGDRGLRRELLERATDQSHGTQVDLLRLALFGNDAELSSVAWRSLVATESIEALPLIIEVMRLELAPDEREALITSLDRLGEQSPKALRLARVQRGLADPAQGFDAQSWRQALESEGGAVWPDNAELAARVEQAEASLRANPDDPRVQLSHAAALYDLAFGDGLDAKLKRLTLEDAHAQALVALEAQSRQGWDANSLVAASARALGRSRAGYAAAVRAMQYAPVDATSWRAKETLALFAEARQRAIYRAMLRKQDWPTSWMSDVHAAFELLAVHPHGDAQDLARHHDYLQALNAKGYASRVLEEGLGRFPHSSEVHARLRARLLEDKSLEALGGLEQTYAALLRTDKGRTPQELGDLQWYAGYASLVAAEFHRRQAQPSSARASYQRAMEHFESAAVQRPDTGPSCEHFIALAQAGLARVALEAGELELAQAQILSSFQRSPMSAANLDGLGITPVMTATTLAARLGEAGQQELAAELAQVVAELPPEVLEKPAFERVAPGTGEAGRSGLRDGRGR